MMRLFYIDTEQNSLLLNLDANYIENICIDIKLLT
jgi:hypothetical protein